MHQPIKTRYSYETRDGLQFTQHGDAIRHEYDVAIPKQLVVTIRSRCQRDLELSEAQAETIAHALLFEPQSILELVMDFIENGEAIDAIAERERQRETAAQVLIEKGICRA